MSDQQFKELINLIRIVGLFMFLNSFIIVAAIRTTTEHGG